MTPEHIEYLGYVASVIVVISMFFHNQKTLRLVNMVGCGLFSWYGYLIDSMPLILTNLFIVLFNIRYFYKVHFSSK